MGFKLGFVLGFGAGFLTGSRAGRDPYDRVSEKVREFRQSDDVERLAEEAKTKAGDLKERAFEKVSGNGGDRGSRTTGQDEAPAGLSAPGGYQPGTSPTGGPMAERASKKV